MNVGEWLRMQANQLLGIDNEEMVEISPFCYLNRAAYDAGLTSMAINVRGEAILNVPIGNSLTPWREWLPNEHDGWRVKRSLKWKI
jgi:hypothetical protein